MTHHVSETPLQVPGEKSIVVLLVDDQRFIGIAVGRLLSGEADLQLHCCHSATDAISQANQVAPTVILQDLQMPDIDGLTLVGLYRANPQTATTPIVVLSGNDDAVSRGKAHAAGADDYLVKLPNKATLVACIRKHVEGRAASSTVEAPAPAGEADAKGDTDVTFDRAVIGDLREAAAPHGAEFVATLIHQFLEEATILVDRITQAALQADMVELKLSSHKLKGTALTIGARRLGTLAGRLEVHADCHPDVKVDGARLPELADELARVRADCLLETQTV